MYYLQKNINDRAIAKEVHHPKEEEGDADNVDDQGMLRGKLPPVWVDELQNVLWDAIEVGGALGVDQVVLGVYVDAMFWFAGLHPLNKIFKGQQDIYLV